MFTVKKFNILIYYTKPQWWKLLCFSVALSKIRHHRVVCVLVALYRRSAVTCTHRGACWQNAENLVEFRFFFFYSTRIFTVLYPIVLSQVIIIKRSIVFIGWPGEVWRFSQNVSFVYRRIISCNTLEKFEFKITKIFSSFFMTTYS